mgnify:CR=1 FL=1
MNDKKLNEINFDFKGIKKITVPSNKANKPFLEEVNKVPIIIKTRRNPLVIFLELSFLLLKKVAQKIGKTVASAQAA